MIQQYIVNKGQKNLCLVFSGWGTDANLFMDYVPQDADLMVCYNYRSMEFDASQLSKYESIKVVAWAMGVWVAEQVFANSKLPIDEAIAFNGTANFADDSQGVPVHILEDILNRFSPKALIEYHHKICGTATEYQAFAPKAPKRKVNEMRAELMALINASLHPEKTNFYWDKAVIGSRDAFFLPSSQNNAWAGNVEEIETVNAAHYSESILRKLICGE